MQVAIEKKEGTEITFKVEIAKERVQEELSQAFRRVVKDVKVDGFRKGKVPRKIFERRFGEAVVREEVIKKIYPEIYQKIIEEHKLVPIIEPTLEIVQFSTDKPLILKIDLVDKPEVTLGKYKGIKIAKKEISVSAEEIETTLKQLQQQHTRYVPLKEKRKTEKNDWVVLDFQVFQQEKLLPGQTQKDFLFKIGSSTFPASFSQGLIGLKAGEEKDLKVEMPSSHPQKDFAGKEFTFKVLLKELRKEEVPLLDNEFAKNLKSDDLEALKKHIQDELQRSKENWEEKRLKKEIIEKAVNDSKVKVPPSLIERRVEERIKELKSKIEEQGADFEDYLKKEKLSEEKLRTRLYKEIEREFSTFFILEGIIEREKIEVREEEIDEKIKKSVNGELKEEKLVRIKKNLDSRGELNTIKARMREQKVINLLYQEARISK